MTAAAGDWRLDLLYSTQSGRQWGGRGGGHLRVEGPAGHLRVEGAAVTFS